MHRLGGVELGQDPRILPLTVPFSMPAGIPPPHSTIPQQWHHWWHQAVIMLLELMVYH